MPKSTATIALNGEIRLADYSTAVQAFTQLMSALSKEVARNAKVEWYVEALEVSSAIATIRGVNTVDPGDDRCIEEIIDAYEDVGEAAQKRKDIPYGEPARAPLSKLLSILNGRVTSVRFETETFDAEVFSPQQLAASATGMGRETIHGAAQGRIQSLSNRGSLRFTLYDSIDDHAISCYLTPGNEDFMRNAWGHLAIVEGMLRRNPVTGLISTIREVSAENVILLDEGGPDDWREAIGCAPPMPNSISPEQAIRRMRDA